MAKSVIQVENLSKQYRIGGRQEKYGSLRESLANSFSNTVNHLRNRQKVAQQETIWALKDVSFEVQQGEVVGIIGRNGAGKSTLLKVLSRITKPTEGIVRLRGRVGSLLEVGTGFHPELTGRENIYLNGAVLGMSRVEIERKFDEIVEFAEIEKFLDTPVKRYSSGMYVRLAFAVAAHLEPEILLVDEVLAVGDAAFQKKCLGKMEEVAEGGRTVLFVSHNMAAIQKLCSRVLLLEQGLLSIDDTPIKGISYYLHKDVGFDGQTPYYINDRLLKESSKGFQITELNLFSSNNEPLRSIMTGDSIVVRFHYTNSQEFSAPAFVVHFRDHLRQEIFRLSTTPISGYPIEKLGKKGYVDLFIEDLPVTAGHYSFDIRFVREGIEPILTLEEVLSIDVSPKDVYGSGKALDRSAGIMVVPHRWVHHKD